MVRARGPRFALGVMAIFMGACGGASSQPLTPDPDPTPTDQDIVALQNAQTSAAEGSDAGGAPPASSSADASKTKPHKP